MHVRSSLQYIGTESKNILTFLGNNWKMKSGITNIVQWILYVQSTNNYSHGRGQINVSVLFAYNYSLCICVDSVAYKPVGNAVGRY